jgi:hypothetical protein
MDYEQELKGHFNTLIKAGSDEVYKIVDELESYIDETQKLTIIEKRVKDIIKNVRADKKLFFSQFKELYPFLLSERKLKEATSEKDEWIILE